MLDAAADQNVAFLQSALIRLGYDPGPIDGSAGARTVTALKDAGLEMGKLRYADHAQSLVTRLRAKFPQEFV